MSLREQFEKETGNTPLLPGIDIYNCRYIKWLEQQIERRDKVIDQFIKWRMSGIMQLTVESLSCLYNTIDNYIKGE